MSRDYRTSTKLRLAGQHPRLSCSIQAAPENLQGPYVDRPCIWREQLGNPTQLFLSDATQIVMVSKQ
jgi:hypothetical protein